MEQTNAVPTALSGLAFSRPQSQTWSRPLRVGLWAKAANRVPAGPRPQGRWVRRTPGPSKSESGLCSFLPASPGSTLLQALGPAGVRTEAPQKQLAQAQGEVGRELSAGTKIHASFAQSCRLEFGHQMLAQCSTEATGLAGRQARPRSSSFTLPGILPLGVGGEGESG